ncbi:hypothetical protein [Sandaracinus amylolyticus]|uniref:hypothetical protein n=1 Tax=Sandaracinus amylolyticus TaxID=927083 RepID=UPI001F347A2D|nr:hypothetical protein [Sandaracinus amylolyticus]UJR79887.1 Hypothetical protein I5071_19270 [Sandaracinus amylolyticus]
MHARTSVLPAILAGLAALLALASLAHADVAPPRPRDVLVVREVRVVEAHAPTEDRDRAIIDVHRAMTGFLPRVERCVRDHGGPRSQGIVRARVRYDRSELPTRTSVVETTLESGYRACVAEVLPSLAMRPAPRGDVTLDIVIASERHFAW